MDTDSMRARPGFRRISISVPAELVVRIDLLAVTRSDYPHRSLLIADALRLYLEHHEGSSTHPAPGA
jgi:metal-responsive CopG/Arc/MetJ family transcriptional regulator